MKFAFEPSSLREILSIKFKTQGLTRPAFNRLIQTQADEAKTQRSSKLASCLPMQEPRLKIKHGH